MGEDIRRGNYLAELGIESSLNLFISSAEVEELPAGIVRNEELRHAIPVDRLSSLLHDLLSAHFYHAIGSCDLRFNFLRVSRTVGPLYPPINKWKDSIPKAAYKNDINNNLFPLS